MKWKYVFEIFRPTFIFAFVKPPTLSQPWKWSWIKIFLPFYNYLSIQRQATPVDQIVQTLMMKISPLHNIPCHLIFWLLVLNCPIKDHQAHVASTDLYTCTCISLNGKRKSYKQTSKISHKYLFDIDFFQEDHGNELHILKC